MAPTWLCKRENNAAVTTTRKRPSNVQRGFRLHLSLYHITGYSW